MPTPVLSTPTPPAPVLPGPVVSGPVVSRPVVSRPVWRATVRRRIAALAGLAGLVFAATTVAAGPVSPALTAAQAAPAAAPLFSDDFEDGNANGWTHSGGQWSIGTDGTRVYRQRSTSSNARSSAGDRAWTDYAVAAEVKPVAISAGRSAVGVLARVQSDGGHYFLALRPGGTVELGKVAGGRSTLLASAPIAVTTGTWYAMRLTVEGNTLTGLAGTTTVSATDSQFAAGRVGVVAAYAAGSFDSVVVEPPAPAAPDTTPPSVPGRPQVLAVTPTTATITWSPATDNVGVASYLIFQGDQFYAQWLSRIVPTNEPVTLPLSPTGANLHFSVAARDAAGNTSAQSSRTMITQPPSFPRSGDETVPPSAPGAPVAIGYAPGGVVLTWTPATDNVGVVEYHVYHTFNIDEVRVAAKVSTNSAVITPRGGSYEAVRVVAYDAAWNSSSSMSVPLTIPPLPTPTPVPPQGR